MIPENSEQEQEKDWNSESINPVKIFLIRKSIFP
jgi:hypothetical protein